MVLLNFEPSLDQLCSLNLTFDPNVAFDRTQLILAVETFISGSNRRKYKGDHDTYIQIWPNCLYM